ncbi:hypothetical protein [Nonomuraea insulae]|uniref:Uncharacterized protein n=1 Tax=Nonomuraea insulae TaxID=1616787 RepID=A0ABW1CQR0_9ACTN
MGGLCVALIPLGISLLRGGPPPTRRAMVWIVVLTLVHILMSAYGPKG